jgi:peptidyl-prolyl cis-trans isomerase A (cyclophilin A)
MAKRLVCSSVLFVAALFVGVACSLPRPPGLPEPPPDPKPTPTNDGAQLTTQESVPPPETKPIDEVPVDAPDGKDPIGGKFTLSDATAGLEGAGALVATIKTSRGDIRCKLFEDRAPTTVANFVGLARGVRPYRSPITKRWVKKPLYDGTTFHRVIKGFMIQGGDPVGDGSGEPGYVIPDEIWPGSIHDHAGQLCMANRGPNTNGAQFFITDASVPRLDGKYTIFGECSPTNVVRSIANVPKDDVDRPTTTVRIDRVTIARE